MAIETTGTAIVGAGLCGLALAEALIARGQAVTLFEARARVGGRVLSQPSDSGGRARYDLGPAWIWPHNRRMLDLVRRLDLPLMEQHAEGRLVFEDRHGAVQRDLEFATMAGALRVVGGLAHVPERLAESLPEGVVRLGHRIGALRAEAQGGVRLSGTTPEGPFDILAERVVLALPPRLVAGMTFTPALDPDTLAKVRAVPTWMAAQGKVVAVYARPFWRAAGLSGDAISHRGPLFEIHDACAEAAPLGEAALFGFLHPAALQAGVSEDALRDGALDQLTGLFGPEAGEPLALRLKLWGRDDLTASTLDRSDLAEHPTYRPIPVQDAPWRNRLTLSGSETAAGEGGYLEGALEAAERTLAEIL